MDVAFRHCGGGVRPAAAVLIGGMVWVWLIFTNFVADLAWPCPPAGYDAVASSGFLIANQLIV